MHQTRFTCSTPTPVCERKRCVPTFFLSANPFAPTASNKERLVQSNVTFAAIRKQCGSSHAPAGSTWVNVVMGSNRKSGGVASSGAALRAACFKGCESSRQGRCSMQGAVRRRPVKAGGGCSLVGGHHHLLRGNEFEAEGEFQVWQIFQRVPYCNS